jgi:FkbM family methyltransferase
MGFSHTDNKGVLLEEKLNAIFNKRSGFFIELGANDGLRQSNTAFLEKKMDWTGILVEPSNMGYRKCLENRPNSTCYNYACVSDEYNEEYISGDFNNMQLMASINGTRLNRTNLIQVKAITLANLLDQHETNNIDFLSLDAEGYELNIIKGLNLDKYRPNYMLVEIYNTDYDEFVEYVTSKNYRLHSNFTNYNSSDNPRWDGTHNDYLFVDIHM